MPVREAVSTPTTYSPFWAGPYKCSRLLAVGRAILGREGGNRAVVMAIEMTDGRRLDAVPDYCTALPKGVRGCYWRWYCGGDG